MKEVGGVLGPPPPPVISAYPDLGWGSAFRGLHSSVFFPAGSLLYEQLGHKAFGLAGKLAASGSITMQNIGGTSREGALGRLR